jgi:hypothetical protein
MQCYIPEGGTFHNCSCEILKSYNEIFMSVSVLTQSQESHHYIIDLKVLREWYYNTYNTGHKLQPLYGCIFGPFRKFYNVARSDWMLSNQGKLIPICSVAHLAGPMYPYHFNLFSIHSGFCIPGLCGLSILICSQKTGLNQQFRNQQMDIISPLNTDWWVSCI